MFIAHFKDVGEWVIAAGQLRKEVIDSSAFLAVKIDDDVVSCLVCGLEKEMCLKLHIVMHFLEWETFEKWNYGKHSDDFPSESILIFN